MGKHGENNKKQTDPQGQVPEVINPRNNTTLPKRQHQAEQHFFGRVVWNVSQNRTNCSLHATFLWDSSQNARFFVGQSHDQKWKLLKTAPACHTAWWEPAKGSNGRYWIKQLAEEARRNHKNLNFFHMLMKLKQILFFQDFRSIQISFLVLVPNLSRSNKTVSSCVMHRVSFWMLQHKAWAKWSKPRMPRHGWNIIKNAHDSDMNPSHWPQPMSLSTKTSARDKNTIFHLPHERTKMSKDPSIRTSRKPSQQAPYSQKSYLSNWAFHLLLTPKPCMVMGRSETFTSVIAPTPQQAEVYSLPHFGMAALVRTKTQDRVWCWYCCTIF